MLHKTRGIVLHQLKYSENSIIAKIYTEQFGLQSYLIKNAHSKKSSVKANVLQPLSLLDLVVYKKAKSTLQHIKEIKNILPQSSIPFDIYKSSIALFINEILYKCIREEEANKSLFEFIFNAILMLDLKENNFQNFHLLFMIKLSKNLGFSPLGGYSEHTPFFDFQEGLFKQNKSEHFYFISPPLSKIFHQLIILNLEQMEELKINNRERKELLNKLIQYYELHITRFAEIKSHQVLEAIMG